VAAFSDYAREAIVAAIVGDAAWPQWDVYLAVHNNSVGVPEITGNGYTRILIDWDTPTQEAGGTYCYPVTNIVFPTQSPSGWIGGDTVALWDAVTGGNRLTEYEISGAFGGTVNKQVVWPAAGLKLGFNATQETDVWRAMVIGYLLKVPGSSPGTIDEFGVSERTASFDPDTAGPNETTIGGYSRVVPSGWMDPSPAVVGKRILSNEQTLMTQTGAFGFYGTQGLIGFFTGGEFAGLDTANGISTNFISTGVNGPGDIFKVKGQDTAGNAVVSVEVT
jgi:hypothetical protein